MTSGYISRPSRETGDHGETKSATERCNSPVEVSTTDRGDLLPLHANPDAVVTEERVRHVLRSKKVKCPSMFAGRLAWSDDHVEALAQALGLRSPIATTEESEA